MKYYSEKLKTLFETPEALDEAERIADKEAAEKESSKKDLATKVELAEVAVENAYKHYAEVKESAEKIAKEATQKIADMLYDAQQMIADAEKRRAEAIKEFNSKFGTYKAVYTGDRAEKEAKRIQALIENIFSWTPWF